MIFCKIKYLVKRIFNPTKPRCRCGNIITDDACICKDCTGEWRHVTSPGGLIEIKLFPPKNKHLFTCNTCDQIKTCDYAWDPYNTDDCLMLNENKRKNRK